MLENASHVMDVVLMNYARGTKLVTKVNNDILRYFGHIEENEKP